MIGLFASLVAPFAGFLASAIKRAQGIKDFGNLLPGHGGIIDRFDCTVVMTLFAVQILNRVLYRDEVLGEVAFTKF